MANLPRFRVIRSLPVFRDPPATRSAGTYLASGCRYAESFLRSTAILLAALSIVFCSVAHAWTAPTAHFSVGEITVASGLNSLYGVAVDGNGNLYVANALTNQVLKETLSGGVYTQSTVGSALNLPQGVAVDGSGNVYIADTGNNRVLKETPSGNTYIQSVVVTAIGTFPEGVAVDINGNVYIADYGDGQVVKETPGPGGIYAQTVVPTPGLHLQVAVAVDAQGNVYIADSGNNEVEKETLSGGTYTQSLVTESASGPRGVAVDAQGNVYVTDSGDALVLKDTPVAGAYSETTLLYIGLEDPYGIAVDGSGNNVYVADNGLRSVLKVLLPPANFGSVNALSTSPAIPLTFIFDTGGTLGTPAVLTLGAANRDFRDTGAGTCSSNLPSHTYRAGDYCNINVTIIPESSGVILGAAELLDSSGNVLATAPLTATGVGPQVTFVPGTPATLASALSEPLGVAVDGSGNVFVVAVGNDTVYKETLSGGPGPRVYSQTTILSGLLAPADLAVDGSGNLYIPNASVVYKETLSNGVYSKSTVVTGLTSLLGIAVDGEGNLYLASGGGHVFKETLTNGSYNQTQIGTGFTSPSGVAVDGSGNVYITDTSSGDVYKETLQASGSYLQSTVATAISTPQSVAVDGGGNLYIAAAGTGDVYKEALQADGSYVQTTMASGLPSLGWVALDRNGNLYVSNEAASGSVSKIDVADGSALTFAATAVGSTSSDSPQTVTVSNIGTAALSFPGLDVPNPASFSPASRWITRPPAPRSPLRAPLAVWQRAAPVSTPSISLRRLWEPSVVVWTSWIPT